jgi:hypothetical protein
VPNLETGETDLVSGYIDDELEMTLLEYLESADRLVSQDVFKDGFRSSLKMSINDENQPSTLNYEVPPDSKLLPLLHCMRPFILQKENCFFGKVTNSLSAILENDLLRGWISLKKRQFSGEYLKKSFSIKVNETQINDKKMLNNWLNGMEFHKDREKRKAVEGLSSVFSVDAQKAIYLLMLMEQTKAIIDVAGLISVMMYRQKEFELKPR